MSEQKKGPQKSPRRRARELALQGVYQWRLTGGDLAEIERNIREEKSLGRYDVELFVRLLRGVLTDPLILQTALQPHLDRPVEELSPIEFSVLLVGAFELAREPETPFRVIVNEAVELAKTFGGSDGHKYVNGVLDKLGATLRPLEARTR